ncbi:MAG TPA: hypothetical protein VFH74_10570 [Gaiellales bacterium]|nr:hypothetical protein [Gaiellales bacterium]
MIDQVISLPDREFLPWFTSIEVGLTLRPGRVFRGYSIAIADENDRTFASSAHYDLPENGSTTITVPISPPRGKNQVVIVKVLNNWNRTVKSERGRV